jgi:hypothetical protein
MALDVAIMGDPRQEVTALAIDNTANDGIYKLAQRVMIVLLTDREDPIQLNAGTGVPGQAFSANVTDLEVIRGQFTNGMSEVRDVLNQTVTTETPDDERLANYEVKVREQSAPDKVDVEILITSEAGNQAVVRLPISNLVTQT